MDCSKTSGIGGLPPGQPLPQKNIDPNRSQSRGIKEIASLGQALAQLEKHQNKSDSKEIWGQSHQPKRHKILICDTHQKPQEIVLKTPPTKSSENYHKEGWENHLEEQRRTIYTYHEGLYKV
jgi:hypothetical protein